MELQGLTFFFLSKKAQEQLLSEITTQIEGMDGQSQVVFLQAEEKELHFFDCLPHFISFHLSSLTILYGTSPTFNKL